MKKLNSNHFCAKKKAGNSSRSPYRHPYERVFGWFQESILGSYPCLKIRTWLLGALSCGASAFDVDWILLNPSEGQSIFARLFQLLVICKKYWNTLREMS